MGTTSRKKKKYAFKAGVDTKPRLEQRVKDDNMPQ